MKLTITHLKLKNPGKLMLLFSHVMKVMKSLRGTNCKAVITRGFIRNHYTMTLWNNEEEMKLFARTGAHLAAMKSSAKIASEISVVTIDADGLLPWKEAICYIESR